MDAWIWAVLAAGIVVALALAWGVATSRRRRRLQERFGPDYGRAVAHAPTRRDAEHRLREREERRAELEVRPLAPGTRDRFLSQWSLTQARFVDDPEGAVGEADDLIRRVMRERGYPADDFEQRAADLSVDHGDVVAAYRDAHAIRRAHTRGEATTEDLRQAFVQFRALFEELLETREPTSV